MKIICSIFGYLLCSLTLEAQSMIFWQSPLRNDWKKMENDYFKIIFPAQVTPIATRIAETLPDYYQKVCQDYDTSGKKIPLILTANSMETNAYVTIPPRKMEWELTPWVDMGFGASDWVSTLAFHESRHVVQFDYATTGFNRLLYLFGGEQALAFGLSSTLPGWFAEGDAVYSETVYSDNGRGRLPFFYQHLKMMVLENRFPTFDQFLLGSSQFSYPDYYVLGYYLTTYIKSKYNEKIFNVVINETAKYSFWPMRFYGALEGVTQQKIEQVYVEMIIDLKEKFLAKEKNINYSEFKKINQLKTDWIDYLAPKKVGQDVIAIKNSLDLPPQLVAIDAKGTETKLKTIPFWFSHRFATDGAKIIYGQKQIHYRWGHESFSNLFLFDINSGKEQQLTRKGKYFQPSFLQGGEKIVAVSITPDLRYDLVILDLARPDQQQVVKNFEQLISYPVDCGVGICYVKSQQNGKKSLHLLNIQSGNEDELISPTNYDLGALYWYQNYIYYHSAQTGSYNIFRLNLHNRQIEQMTSARYGAYYPSVSDGNLYYSDFGSDGYDVVTKNNIPLATKLENGRTLLAYSENFSTQVNRKAPSTKKNIIAPPVENYGSSEDFFNIHSWLFNITYPDIGAGFKIATDDYLNRFGMNAGVTKKFKIDEMQAYVAAEYKALYPIFRLQLDHQIRQIDYVSSPGIKKISRWKEQGADINTFFVHNFFSESRLNKLILQFGETIKRLEYGAKFVNSPIYDSDFWIQKVEFGFQSTGQMAFRNLFPRWGNNFRILYSDGKSIGGRKLHGQLVGVYSDNYFPGFGFNHGMQLYLARERQLGREGYVFLSEITPPRGHTVPFHPEIAKLTFNYALPLSYLDLNLLSGIYLTRLYSVLFYDHSLGSNDIDRSGRKNYSAFGSEFNLETKLLRMPVPFVLGLRYLYNVQEKKKVGEVLLQLSIAS